jgi:hypothetical protein
MPTSLILLATGLAIGLPALFYARRSTGSWAIGFAGGIVFGIFVTLGAVGAVDGFLLVLEPSLGLRLAAVTGVAAAVGLPLAGRALAPVRSR